MLMLKISKCTMAIGYYSQRSVQYDRISSQQLSFLLDMFSSPIYLPLICLLLYSSMLQWCKLL